MIQLATDPNARRSNWRPEAAEAQDSTLAGRRPRSGHAWPFIVRYTERTAAPQESKQGRSSDNGS